jgi:hypothetical protein
MAGTKKDLPFVSAGAETGQALFSHFYVYNQLISRR